MEVESSVITRIRRINLEYVCARERTAIGFEFGQNLSSPLNWTGAPDGTVSFALIIDGTDNLVDPKTPEEGVPPAVHWVIWNIPADVTELPEAIATTTEVASIGPKVRQGLNDDGLPGYTGPCPPPIGLARSTTGQSGGGSSIYTMGAPVRAADIFLFKVYALDTEIELGSDATKNDLLWAMDGHIRAAGQMERTLPRRSASSDA
jgi:Raf kinase inhibitor-like YbhB/YbcL family protein